MSDPNASLRKTSDDTPTFFPGPNDYAGHDLGVVGDNYSAMAVVVEAAKKKGVRFDEGDFQDNDVECLNNNVVIFRGAAADFVYSLFQGGEHGRPGHEVPGDF